MEFDSDSFTDLGLCAVCAYSAVFAAAYDKDIPAVLLGLAAAWLASRLLRRINRD